MILGLEFCYQGYQVKQEMELFRQEMELFW